MKASKLIPAVSIIIMVLITSSCILNMICINGDGIPGVEERATGPFNGVINATQANVVFETGDVLSLLIECDANLLPHFTTSVRNGILEIDIKGTSCIKTVSPTFIRITAPSMESFTLSGSGDITVISSQMQEKTTNLSGSGDTNITGQADNGFFTSTGSGHIIQLSR